MINNNKIHLWLRAETKSNEYRTPITPLIAKKLIDFGYKITIEKSINRCFSDEEYKDVMCEMVEPNTWISAPSDTFIVGLKELPSDLTEITHRHIYFSHCYKNQNGWDILIKKFIKGKGQILDIEYLLDENNVRIAAFGKSAGIAGALISLMVWLEQKKNGQNAKIAKINSFHNVDDITNLIIEKLNQNSEKPNVLVIGSKGRVGLGATSILDKLNIKYTGWTRSDTDNKGPFNEILNYDILLNCINLDKKIKPFITLEMLNKPNRNLTVCIDISCDYANPNNPIAIYNKGTTFDDPIHNIITDESFMDIIAIDNLPSFIPRESSNEFSEQFYEALIKLESWDNIWVRAEKLFLEKSSLVQI